MSLFTFQIFLCTIDRARYLQDRLNIDRSQTANTYILKNSGSRKLGWLEFFKSRLNIPLTILPLTILVFTYFSLIYQNIFTKQYPIQSLMTYLVLAIQPFLIAVHSVLLQHKLVKYNFYHGRFSETSVETRKSALTFQWSVKKLHPIKHSHDRNQKVQLLLCHPVSRLLVLFRRGNNIFQTCMYANDTEGFSHLIVGNHCTVECPYFQTKLPQKFFFSPEFKTYRYHVKLSIHNRLSLSQIFFLSTNLHAINSQSKTFI